MDRCGVVVDRCGSLWIVVGHGGSLWVVPGFSNYEGLTELQLWPACFSENITILQYVEKEIC